MKYDISTLYSYLPLKNYNNMIWNMKIWHLNSVLVPAVKNDNMIWNMKSQLCTRICHEKITTIWYEIWKYDISTPVGTRTCHQNMTIWYEIWKYDNNMIWNMKIWHLNSVLVPAMKKLQQYDMKYENMTSQLCTRTCHENMTTIWYEIWKYDISTLYSYLPSKYDNMIWNMKIWQQYDMKYENMTSQLCTRTCHEKITTIWYEIWKYDISTLYSYLPWKYDNMIWNMKIWHLNSVLVPAMKIWQQYDMKYENMTSQLCTRTCHEKITTIWYEIWHLNSVLVPAVKNDNNIIWNMKVWHLNSVLIPAMKKWQQYDMKIWHLNSVLVPAMKNDNIIWNMKSQLCTRTCSEKLQQYDMKYDISTLYSYLPWKYDNNMIWNMKIWHLNSVLVPAMKNDNNMIWNMKIWHLNMKIWHLNSVLVSAMKKWQQYDMKYENMTSQYENDISIWNLNSVLVPAMKNDNNMIWNMKIWHLNMKIRHLNMKIWHLNMKIRHLNMKIWHLNSVLVSAMKKWQHDMKYENMTSQLCTRICHEKITTIWYENMTSQPCTRTCHEKMTTIWYEIWKYDISIWKYDISTLYSYLPWKNDNNIWNMKIWHLNMKIWHLNSVLVSTMKKRQQYDMKYENMTSQYENMTSQLCTRTCHEKMTTIWYEIWKYDISTLYSYLP